MIYVVFYKVKRMLDENVYFFATMLDDNVNHLNMLYNLIGLSMTTYSITHC